MLSIIITIVHVIVSLVLILVILLQAGKGGGLSDMFGGAMTQNQKLFGAETNTFLTKATSYSAIIFIITCISLGYLTTNRSRSLIEGRQFEALPVTLPQGAPDGALKPVVEIPETGGVPAAPVLPETPQAVPSAPSASDATGANAPPQ